jgi:hypothetical protein
VWTISPPTEIIDRFPGLVNARRWLDQNLFPEAPRPPRGLRARDLAVAAGVVVLLVGLELARMWPSHPLTTIWAEDGFTYLAGAIHRGFFGALTTPYNGYLQTSSRLLAQPVAALPHSWFAPVMALAGAAVVAGSAILVWYAAAGHVTDTYLRGALALLVVLLPVAGVEMLDNVVNSVWYLLFVSFWLLLWRPATFARAVGAASLLLLIALSTAGVVFMLPLWLLRALAIRDRRDVVIVAALPIGLAAQVAPVANQTYTIFTRPHWDWGLFPAYAQRVIGGSILGSSLSGDLWRHVGTPVEIALAAGLAACLALVLLNGSPASRLLVPLGVGISLVAFLLTGYERGAAGQLLWVHGASNNGGSRYVVVPSLLLLSALFVAIAAPARRTPRGSRLRAAVAVVLVASLFSFDISDTSVRGFPTWSAALRDAQTQCASENATTVRVLVNPAILGYALPLSCRGLR